jgi:hypothetical protein
MKVNHHAIKKVLIRSADTMNSIEGGFIYILCSVLYKKNMWQDIVLTIINFGFMITAIPAIIRNYKIKEAKSQSLSMYLATAVLLAVMAYVFFTLDLLLSGLSTAGTGLMWFLLTAQKIKYSR